jgi:hypothetical protein
MSAVGKDQIRFVTHLDVDRGACISAAEVLTEEIEGEFPAKKIAD